MGGPTIAASMLSPLLIMAVGFTTLFLTLHMLAIRNEIMRPPAAPSFDARGRRGHVAPRGAGAGGMNLAAPHIGFVIAAYAIALLWSLAAWSSGRLVNYRTLKKQLERVETRPQAQRDANS